MRIYLGSCLSEASNDTHRVSRFVSSLPIALAAAWLLATPSVASRSPTTQAPAAWPYSDAAPVSPAAAIAHSLKFSATDAEDDGDDQDDPDDPNDTLAAADAFWWGAADLALRATQTQRERQPRLEAFADQVVQAA